MFIADNRVPSTLFAPHTLSMIPYYPVPYLPSHLHPSLHAENRVASALIKHYSLIMKSDFDAFLTPGFMVHAPKQLTFGIQE